jgi:hypothetical protein
VVALVALGLWVEFGSRGSVQEGEPLGGASQPTDQVLPPVDVSVDEVEHAYASELDAGEEGRAGVRVISVVGGRVLDSGERPISGAEVTWTPVRLLRAGAVSMLASRDGLQAGSERTVSGVSGEFAFSDLTLVEEGVIWVSALGFQPASLRVGPATSDEAARVVVLEDAAPVSVMVQDSEGRSVPNALVVETGFRGTRMTLEKGDRFAFDLQAFARSARTDLAGRALLCSGLPFVRFQAFAQEGRVSQSIVRKPEGKFTLTIGDRVDVVGRIDGLQGLGSALVMVNHVNSDGAERFLDCLDVDSSGAILSRSVPRFDDGDYLVLVEGPNIVPEALHLLPSGDGKLQVRLRVLPASKLALHCVTAGGEPVANVKVRFNWDADTGEVQWAAGAYYSDADGRVELACPKGAVYLEIRHPDYLPQDPPEALLAPTEGEEFYTVVMESFGSVEGVVSRMGQTLSDFDVHYYVEGPEVDMRTLEVRGAEDGVFRIEKAPLGEVHFLVFERLEEMGGAQSEPVVVEVVPGETAKVAVELPRGSDGRGIVMDVRGGVPDDLYVERSLRTGARYPWASSERITPDADGRFVVRGLTAPREELQVVAPGYSLVLLDATRGADGTYDFGTAIVVEFSRLDLFVTLPQGVDPAQCTISTAGMVRSGVQLLPADGHVILEGATAGFTTVSLKVPSGQTLEFDLRLRGDGPWERTLDVSGEGEVLVQVIGDHSLLPEGAWVQASWTNGPEADDVATYFGVSVDELTLTGLPRIPVTIAIRTPDGRLLAEGWATPGPPGEVTLALDLDKEGWSVLVLDEQGVPMEGVRVACWDLSGAHTARGPRTGAEGIAQMGVKPDGVVQVLLTAPDRSKCANLEIDCSRGSSPFTLTFRSGESLDLVVKDGSEPLEGLELWAYDSHRIDLVGWPRVGLGGAWRLRGISVGEYMLEPQTPNVWHDVKAVICDGTSAIQEVQFRRKASVRVVVRDAYGNPAAGVDVGLRSVEYDMDVAVWLADGRIESVTGLVTDANGEVVVSEVPRGPYTWSVAGQSGEVDAPALGVGVVEVKLAP